MIKVTEVDNLREVYNFQMSFETPYFFSVDFDSWKQSFIADIDGEGRVLFKDLKVIGVYDSGELIGFVQYGKTAFGFNDNGEISSDISYPVIRSLYFKKDKTDAGLQLLKIALQDLGNDEKIYAFFHYFGMTCLARHGKLYEKHAHIENLLAENGFVIEHENVYYSSVLNGTDPKEIEIKPNDLSIGSQQYIEFSMDGAQVGGCEVHYLDDNKAYLRWIYVNGDITGKGIGTKCMSSLKMYLYQKGIRKFDTDTALNNIVAQHYYEKNNFTRQGLTKSYYLNNSE